MLFDRVLLNSPVRVELTQVFCPVQVTEALLLSYGDLKLLLLEKRAFSVSTISLPPRITYLSLFLSRK